MVVFLPLLMAIAIVGYFRYSPSWLGKTTRYLLKSMIETPYELKPPGWKIIKFILKVNNISLFFYFNFYQYIVLIIKNMNKVFEIKNTHLL